MWSTVRGSENNAREEVCKEQGPRITEKPSKDLPILVKRQYSEAAKRALRFAGPAGSASLFFSFRVAGKISNSERAARELQKNP
jgi:hypothetical protein